MRVGRALALVADDADCMLTIGTVVAGTLYEAQFAPWMRQHTVPR